MGYIVCFIVGTFVGVILMCLMVACKNNDYIESNHEEEEDQ